VIIHETLAHLGLSSRETDVYLSLLKLGPVSIREIAESAGINRGTTYEILKLLREKMLVTYFPKGKRKFFCAEPPEVLLKLAEERQQIINQSLITLKTDILPNLNAIRPDELTTNVHHYEGDEGIEYVLKDILRTVEQQRNQHADKLYRVYSSRLIRKYLYRPFPNFTRQRVERSIYVKVIAIGEGGEEAPLAARKWIPVEQSDPAASYVAIYPPKCAMISLIKGDYPTAVIIDSDAVATALKISFDSLWERL